MDPVVVLVVVVGLIAVTVIGIVVMRRRQPPDVAVGQGAPRFDLGAAVRRALGGTLGAGTWDEIEDALLAADVGVAATSDIVEAVRRTGPSDGVEARSALRSGLAAELSGRERGLALESKPAVILVVGVNGTGKTTTIAKLARWLDGEGRSVVLGGADTFRAAAGLQLKTWGDRLAVPVVAGQEGGDPASVAFDAVESGRARGADVVIIDTAGRLHGKKNLMEELAKIHRVAGGERVDEVLLVLDASLGQNGLNQAEEFSGAVPISGIVLTKLDGTARGGIVIAVERRLGIPIKFVGLGEGLDDLAPFDPDSFVDSLLEGA